MPLDHNSGGEHLAVEPRSLVPPRGRHESRARRGASSESPARFLFGGIHRYAGGVVFGFFCSGIRWRSVMSAKTHSHSSAVRHNSTVHNDRNRSPFCVLIRTVRLSDSPLQGENWRVLKRFGSQQEALKAIAAHQRDPRNARQFQYRMTTE